MDSYQIIKARHSDLPAYAPLIPTSALPAIAVFFLCTSFALTFFLTTLRKSTIPLPEIATALAAAFLAGGGVVALFCTAGVYV